MTDQTQPQPDDITALPAIPNDLRNLMDLLTSTQDQFQPFLRSAKTGQVDDATGAGGLDNPMGFVDGNLNSMSLGSGSLAAMFFGQSNFLPDPTFEQVASASYVGGFPLGPTTVGLWKHQRILNSGAASATHSYFGTRSRLDQFNPFNSAVLALGLDDPTGPANNTFYIWPRDDFDCGQSAPLDYMVATCKVADLGFAANDYTNVTTVTAQLEIYNVSSSTVVAVSDLIDLKTMAYRDQRQMVAAYQTDAASFRAALWRFRIRIDTVVASAGGGFELSFGEPVMRFAYSPEGGGPHTPPVGDWFPTGLRQHYGSGEASFPLIDTYADAQTNPTFELDRYGTLRWGDGAGGAVDTDLSRLSAGILNTTSEFQIGNPTAGGGSGVQMRPGGSMELAANASTPFIDFKNAATDDFDARIILTGDDVLEVQGAALGLRRLLYATAGVISPGTITANTDNWNPTNLGVANLIRIITDATIRTITGIVAQDAGTLIYLHNRNTATNIILAHDVTSTGANRFYCPGAVDYTLLPKATVALYYSGSDSRWLVHG